jgi:uncharacterized protein (DUF433 family)
MYETDISPHTLRVDAPYRAVPNSFGNTVMPTITDIGALIVRSDDIRGGRPRLAGTGVTVRRIVGWYKRGLTPEEITMEVPHLSLAQIYAALTYYHANREEIETDITAEEAEAPHLERPQAPQWNTP